MRSSSLFDTLFRIVFILYCVEAGVFLAMAPWKEVWERVLLEIPSLPVRQILMHPVSRSAVTGFGLIHLVWGAHDLEDWLLRRKTRAAAPPPTQEVVPE